MATFVYPPVTISTVGLATETTLSAINTKINDDYGASSGAVRTAAQVGNSTGAASFGSGVVGAQTLRVVLPTDQPAVAVTGPVTDAQLRASAVPVSGPLTDTQLRASAVPISAAALPLPSGAATEATLSSLNSRLPGGFVPSAFDYQSITYVGATTDISTVVYKTGGSGGTTVATLTMGYDGSNRLSSVTKT